LSNEKDRNDDVDDDAESEEAHANVSATACKIQGEQCSKAGVLTTTTARSP
jgi:hypothetical protein